MPPVTEAGRVLADTLVVTPSLLTKRTFFFGKLLKVWPKKKAKESEIAEPFKDLMKERRKKSSPLRRVTKHKPAPCEVPFFKVDPQCVNSTDLSNVVVVKGGRNEYEELIHSFLNMHYWPREPCVLGLWVPLCSSYLQTQNKRFVTSGDRWLAFDDSGGKRSLIGVLVAQKTYPWQADELEWSAQSKCFRPEEKHLYFRAHTLRSSNLFEKYGVPYVYNIEVLATGGSKYLGERVAELLLRTSITHALEMRHPLTMIVARNCKEACTCEKMGMFWEWSMNDDEYVDPTGKRMFFPRLPNQTVSVYIRKIDIEGSILDDIYSPVFIRNIYEDPEDIFEEQEELTITDNPFTCDSQITEATTHFNHDINKSLGMQMSEMSGMPYHTIPSSNIEQPFNITSDKTKTCTHNSFDTGLVYGDDLDTLTANLKSTQYSDSATYDTKTPTINYSKSGHTKSSLVNDSTSFDNKTPLNDSIPGNTETLKTYGYAYDYYNAPGYSTSVVKTTPVINYSTSLDTKTPLNDSIPDNTETLKTYGYTYYDYYKAPGYSTSVVKTTPAINYSTSLDTKTPLNDSIPGNTETLKTYGYTYDYYKAPGYSTSVVKTTPVINYSTSLDTKTPLNYSTADTTETPEISNNSYYYCNAPVIDTFLNTKTTLNDSKPGNTKRLDINLKKYYHPEAPVTGYSTTLDMKTNLNDLTPVSTKTKKIISHKYNRNEPRLTSYSRFLNNKTPFRNTSKTHNHNKTPLMDNSTCIYNKIPIRNDPTSLNTKTSDNNNVPEINNKTYNYNEASVIHNSTFSGNKTPPNYYSISLYRQKKQTNK